MTVLIMVEDMMYRVRMRLMRHSSESAKNKLIIFTIVDVSPWGQWRMEVKEKGSVRWQRGCGITNLHGSCRIGSGLPGIPGV